MQDSGFNHRYVYILGQRPVFECFDVRLRSKLRAVNLWLRDHVRKYVLTRDHAQRVIRRCFMRVKLFRALCLSVPHTTLEHFNFLTGNYCDESTDLISTREKMRTYMYSIYTKIPESNVMTKIMAKDLEKRWSRIVDNYFIYLPPQFVQGARIVPAEDIQGDVIQYITVKILGGKNRIFNALANELVFIHHALSEETTTVRFFVNLPCPYRLSVDVINCVDKKVVALSPLYISAIRQHLYQSEYKNPQHTFCVEEFSSGGKMLRKHYYQRNVMAKQWLTIF